MKTTYHPDHQINRVWKVLDEFWGGFFGADKLSTVYKAFKPMVAFPKNKSVLLNLVSEVDATTIINFVLNYETFASKYIEIDYSENMEEIADSVEELINPDNLPNILNDLFLGWTKGTMGQTFLNEVYRLHPSDGYYKAMLNKLWARIDQE